MLKRTTRIVLVNPPSAEGTTANREGAGGLGTVVRSRSAFFYPPYTIALLVSQLRRAGLDAEGLDCVGKKLSFEYALKLLAEHTNRPELVGVQTSVMSAAADIKFATAVVRSLPGARVFLFGASVHLVLDKIWSVPELKYVLAGEPEASIVSFSKSCLNGDSTPVRSVKHATQQIGPGELPRVQELDTLPFPAWGPPGKLRYPFLTVLSSRGCPLRCTYCPYVVGLGGRLRSQSPPRTVEELLHIRNRYLCRHVIFRDPVFAADRERVILLTDEMRRRNVHVSWECESRPEHFDPELLKLMAQAGCRRIKIGVETVSERLLLRYRRVESHEEYQHYLHSIGEAVAAARKHNIGSDVFIMIGLPGESADDVEKTAQFIEEIKPSKVVVKIFENYPGTPIYTKKDTTTLSAAYTNLLCLREELRARFEVHRPQTRYTLVPRRLRSLMKRLLHGRG